MAFTSPPCPKCQVPWHEGLTCDQAMAIYFSYYIDEIKVTKPMEPKPERSIGRI